MCLRRWRADQPRWSLRTHKRERDHNVATIRTTPDAEVEIRGGISAASGCLHTTQCTIEHTWNCHDVWEGERERGGGKRDCVRWQAGCDCDVAGAVTLCLLGLNLNFQQLACPTASVLNSSIVNMQPSPVLRVRAHTSSFGCQHRHEWRDFRQFCECAVTTLVIEQYAAC